jgi:hypothetical protein
VDVRVRQYLMGHKDGGPVITRYTKVTADTEREIRDAVRVFDEIRTTKDNVTSMHARRRSAKKGAA